MPASPPTRTSCLARRTLDIATATLALLISVMIPTSNAAIYFEPSVQIPSVSFPQTVAIGDVNNDTHPDVVIMTDDGDSVATYLGVGDGTLGPLVGTTISFIGPAVEVVLGHFNADANLDLAWGGGAFLTFQAGDGAGGFGTPQLLFGPGSYPVRVATGDFNEDTKLDLVTSYEDEPGAVGVHLGNGDGTFDGGTAFGTSPYAQGIAVGDFNNDTHLDLAVACRGSSIPINVVSVLMGNGDGTFSGKTDYLVNLEPVGIVTADFNGDTKLDLATTGLDGKAAIVLGNGAGAFGSKVEYTIGTEGHSIATGDLDGDGKLDLLVPDSGFFLGGTQLATLKGNGDGTFETSTPVDVGDGPTDVAIADLNHDGKLDAVVTNMDYDNLNGGYFISVLRNCVPCIPTAVDVVLEQIEVIGERRVRATWLMPGGSSVFGLVQRKQEGGDWLDLTPYGPIDGSRFTYEDETVSPGLRYAYRLSLHDATDNWMTSEAWVYVPAVEAAPAQLTLRPPYPNPTRGSVSLRFGQPSDGSVLLRIFDVSGRLVAAVARERRPAGWGSATWNGTTASGIRAPSGVYFAVLEVAGENVRRRFVLTR